MKKLADLEKINLYYFDESGFSCIPSVPYAWQPIGETRELPSFPSKRLNVLGFISIQGKSSFFPIEGNINSEKVINTFDEFTLTYETEYLFHKKPCIVILDNAPTHTSRELLKHIDKWGARGVLFHYLPTYSPELNLIEILWRKIKYDWLPLSCYSSFTNLKNAVLEILNGFGSIYQITFE